MSDDTGETVSGSSPKLIFLHVHIQMSNSLSTYEPDLYTKLILDRNPAKSVNTARS